MGHLNESAVVVELSSVLPRVLIVSRRTVRKNKFVDFVGEYHLDLIVNYGAVPVIVPRVSGLHSLLDSFEPIHGVLLCEGEDIDPTLYDSDISLLSIEDVEEIKRTHSSDTLIDKNKDSIELQLARRCLERNIPYLGICRGSQVLNVACGGSLYQDVEKELSSKSGVKVRHINYDDYDGHRHPVKVVEGTPLHEWFKQSLEQKSADMSLNVNSYHHQGVKRLAQRFEPMAYAPDGLIEAFYDPDVYNPSEGKFIIGLQFHPERMRHSEDGNSSDASIEGDFDYPECPRAYQEFVKAVIAYQKKLTRVPPKLDGDLEKERQKLIRSFSLAKHIYQEEQFCKHSHWKKTTIEAVKMSRAKSSRDLEAGAEFLHLNEFDREQVERLKQMGATVRSSSVLLEKLQSSKQRRSIAKSLMEGMKTADLVEMHDFYKMMNEICDDVLQTRTSG